MYLRRKYYKITYLSHLKYCLFTYMSHTDSTEHTDFLI